MSMCPTGAAFSPPRESSRGISESLKAASLTRSDPLGPDLPEPWITSARSQVVILFTGESPTLNLSESIRIPSGRGVHDIDRRRGFRRRSGVARFRGFPRNTRHRRGLIILAIDDRPTNPAENSFRCLDHLLVPPFLCSRFTRVKLVGLPEIGRNPRKPSGDTLRTLMEASLWQLTHSQDRASQCSISVSGLTHLSVN